METMQIIIDAPADPVLESCARILARELAQRGGIEAQRCDAIAGELPALTLQIADDLPPEAFRIERDSARSARIIGGDARGVLYGCGRFLRACRWGKGAIEMPPSEGPSVPDKSLRGMYFAVHMHNWYHAAPIEAVERYIEELAMWGINTLSVYYHLFHFKSIEDPACQEFIARLNAMFDAARAVGMKTVVLVTANDGYLDSPEELRYVGEVPRNWGTELCPAKPGALELLEAQFAEAFAQFPDADYLNIWPYDSGGCLCEHCSPWAGKGFVRTAAMIARTFRKSHPAGKVILSTWMFDYNCGEIGEWDAFYEQLNNGQLDWVDLIMADGAYVNGYFPQRVLDEPPPKPVISFLEISMQTGAPWGSFGANPMPAVIESEWQRIHAAIEGGTPYSEGIFEDVNKFVWAQLCWSEKRGVQDILEEYAAHEFAPASAATVAQALFEIEKVGRRNPIETGANQIVLEDPSRCEQIWQTLERVARGLPLNQRRSWRWRLVLLRAQIDAELARSHGAPTATLGRALDELNELYCVTDESLWFVRPYEVEAAEDEPLRFVQNGLTISDICDFKSNDEREIAAA